MKLGLGCVCVGRAGCCRISLRKRYLRVCVNGVVPKNPGVEGFFCYFGVCWGRFWGFFIF